MDQKYLASALVSLLENSRGELTARIKAELDLSAISQASVVIDQWLDGLLSFFKGGPGRLSEWLSLIVERSRRTGGNIRDIHTVIRAVHKSMYLFMAGKVEGVSDAELFTVLFEAEDQLSRMVVRIYDEYMSKMAAAEQRKRKMIAETSRHPFVIVDKEATITLVNSLFAKFVGMAEEHLMGANFLNLCEPKLATDLRRELRQKRNVSGRLTGGGIISQGNNVQVRFRLLPLFDEEGLREGMGLVVYTPAVTSVAVAQAGFLENMAKGLGLAYYLVERGGRVTTADTAAQAYVEAGREEQPCYCCRQHLSEKVACPGCMHQKPFDTGESRQSTLQVRTLAGENRWVEMTCIPLQDEEGEVSHVAKLLRDVTEQKILEDQLLQQQMTNQMTQLAVGVAHQLRNPLGVMIGFAEMMGRGLPPEQVPVAIEKILANGIRCKEVVENLLELGRLTLEDCERVDVALLLREKVQPLYKAEMQKRVTWDIDEQPMLVKCIPDQLALALLHLMDMQVRRADTEIRVEVRGGDRGVSILIRRDGKAPAEGEGRLIHGDANVRVEAEDKQGLVISLVRRFLEGMGGKLTCGEGEQQRTVILQLPACEASPAAKEAEIAAEPAHSAKRNILIIEDEADQLFLLALALESAGHEVDKAMTTGEGINLVSQKNYDGIVIDILLGDGLGGRDIYQFISRFNPSLISRTLFITGDTMKYETRRFLQEVKRPVLEKPFLISDLVSDLDAVIKGARTAKATA